MSELFKFEEIDGLPRAYMDFRDGEGLTRFVFKTVAYGWFPDDEAAIEAIAIIKRRMVGYFGRELILDNIPFIIWRKRPVVERLYDFGICFNMRFQTSPPLPKEFWEKYGIEEGCCAIRHGEELFRK